MISGKLNVSCNTFNITLCRQVLLCKNVFENWDRVKVSFSTNCEKVIRQIKRNNFKGNAYLMKRTRLRDISENSFTEK